MKFKFYQDAGKQWRWRLVAENGRIVADSSEGYVTEHNARRAAQVVIRELSKERS
jgi:uncharacterized protein YegP (UPF0339 family)